MTGSTKKSFTVSLISTQTTSEVIEELFDLQNGFAEEHLKVSRKLYGDVRSGEEITLQDWKNLLISGADLRVEERVKKFLSLIQADQGPLFMKASQYPENGGSGKHVSGFIMFWIRSVPLIRKRKAPGTAQDTENYVWIQQVYVRPECRSSSCGTTLLDGMLKHAKSVNSKCEHDVRLTVLDVNTIAKSWYHKMGFRVVNLQREFIGRKDLRRTVVFEELRWLRAPRLKLPDFCLFKQILVNEEVTVDSPDENPSPFKVRVLSYKSESKEKGKHLCAKLFSDKADSFHAKDDTVELDLNTLYRNNHLILGRSLSTLFHEVELRKKVPEGEQANQIVKELTEDLSAKQSTEVKRRLRLIRQVSNTDNPLGIKPGATGWEAESFRVAVEELIDQVKAKIQGT